MIIEKVARAICLSVGDSHFADAAWPEHEDTAAAAIKAFLAAAAENGWHMRPDEATKAMVEAAEPLLLYWLGNGKILSRSCKNCYRAMCTAAPEFELEK